MNKKRILVVDDEVSITRLLKLNLEQTGEYEVREENLGAMALPAAKEFQPDLIIMDVMMPDLGGGEAVGLLQADPTLRRVPVVFLTAAVRREELGGPDAKISGRTYIAKPLDVPGVLRVIERTLSS